MNSKEFPVDIDLGKGTKLFFKLKMLPEALYAPLLWNGELLNHQKWARRVLVRQVAKNPKATLKELQKSSTEMRESAGRMTISEKLHESGLDRVARQMPLLRKRQNIWEKEHMAQQLELSLTTVKHGGAASCCGVAYHWQGGEHR